MRAMRSEFATKETGPARQWCFDPFVPDVVDRDGGSTPWEDIPTDELARDPACWALEPGADWHGYRHVAPGYAMTDPAKLTVLTPGFDRHTGAYAAHGIPAPVVAEFLRDYQVVPEKNALNSLLFLLTPAVHSNQAGRLLSALVTFTRSPDT